MAQPLKPDVIDAQTVDDFRRLGACVVRGLFTPDEVAAVERGIERVLAEAALPTLGASAENAD